MRSDVSSVPAGRQPQLPAFLIAGIALLLAVVGARLIATGRVPAGIATAVAATYLLVVLVNIAWAIAGWVALLFISGLPILGVGPTLVELLLVLAWIGAGGIGRGRLPVLRGHRGAIVAIVLFACWLALSAAWADSAGRAGSGLAYWLESMLVFVIVGTSLANTRDVLWLALAFVVGSVAAIALGLLGIGAFSHPLSESDQGRLVAAGDPNYQAAAFLAAMCMAGGLMSAFRSTTARVMLGIALVFIAVGFFATESRGGLLALAFALVAAFALFREQRRQIAVLALVGAAAVGAWLSTRPDALHRLTTFGGGGSGREDLWTVAWRVFRAHPYSGVGLGNFRVVESHFVLKPGSLTHVAKISEGHSLVHNAYLELLAETGIFGVAAFAIVAFLCMRASWRAAIRFDESGEPGLANLARAILIATIGMLAAMFFISAAQDYRLWVFFALGPVLNTLATNARPSNARAWSSRSPL